MTHHFCVLKLFDWPVVCAMCLNWKCKQMSFTSWLSNGLAIVVSAQPCSFKNGFKIICPEPVSQRSEWCWSQTIPSAKTFQNILLHTSQNSICWRYGRKKLKEPDVVHCVRKGKNVPTSMYVTIYGCVYIFIVSLLPKEPLNRITYQHSQMH